MKIQIDRDRCQGFFRCRALAPEMFEVEEDNKSLVLNDGEVPPGMEDDAEEAIAKCPAKAISIVSS